MNKLQMAHDFAMKLAGNPNTPLKTLESIVDISWKYADAMQAEADKREPSGFPNVLRGACGEIVAVKVDDKEWQPDWSQAPEWAKYFAMDEDGGFYYFEESPFMAVHSWQPQPHGELDETFDHGYKGNWQDSLRKRPQ